MNKEDYTKLIQSNVETNQMLEIQATINAITYFLISKGICSKEEFEKIKEKCKIEAIEYNYLHEKPEDLKTLKTFNDLFGGLF